MQEVHIDHSEFDRLVQKLDETPQVIAEAKRQALEAAAPQLQRLVQNEIGGSGRVRSWQEAYVGSWGGYAAARPRAKTWAASQGMKTYEARLRKPPTYAVGYITNAINSGHKAPRNKAGDRPCGRIVTGRLFYESAQLQAEPVSQKVAQEIVQAVKKHLEG